MRISSKLALAALTALVTLLSLAGAASANRLSVDDIDFEAIWLENRLSFTSSIGVTTRCEVTLLGHFHSATITKTPGLLIGFVDHVRVEDSRCSGGRATALTATLPWHVQYRSFTGTLPNITGASISLIGAQFQVQQTILGAAVTCLATTTLAEPAIGTIAVSGGTATNIGASGEIDTRDTTGTSCDNFGVRGNFSGTGLITDLGGNPIRVTLI